MSVRWLPILLFLLVAPPLLSAQADESPGAVAEARAMRAFGFLEAGAFAKAKAGFEEASRLFGSLSKPLADLLGGLAEAAALEEAGDSAKAVKALAGLSARAERNRKEAWAEPTRRAAIAAAKRAGDAVGEARNRAMLAQLFSNIGKRKKAVEEGTAALETARAAGDASAMAVASLILGHAALDTLKYAEALPHYKNAVEHGKATGNVVVVVHGLQGLAFSHYRQNRFVEARRWFEAELAYALEHKMEPQRIGTCYMNCAQLNWDLEDHAALADVIGRGLAYAEEAKRPRLRANLLRRRAMLALAGGKRQSAILDYRAAEKTYRDIGYQQGVTSSCLMMADVHANAGRGDKALRVLMKRLREVDGLIAAKPTKPLHRDRARLLLDIGSTQFSLGRFDKALDALTAARAAAATAEDRKHTARILSMLGTVYWGLGENERALATFQDARAKAQAIGDARSALIALGNIGVIQHEMGDLKGSLETTQRAMKLARQRRDLKAEVSHMRSTAQTLAKLGRKAEGRALMAQALERAKGLQDKLEALTLRGAAADHIADPQARIAALREIADEAHSYPAAPQEIQARTTLARLLLKAGQPEDALRECETAARELEEILGGLGDTHGSSARRNYADIYAIGAVAAARAGRTRDVFQMLERARAGLLVGALHARELVDWSDLPEELQVAQAKARSDVRRAQERVQRAARRGNLQASRSAATKLKDALAERRSVADRVQRAMKRQARLAFPRVPPIGVIQDTLSEDQALIVFGMCLGELLAVVITADDERVVTYGKNKPVRDAVVALVLDDPEIDPTASLAALRGLLVGPLELGENIREVVLAPDGVLCQAPLGLIFHTRTVAFTPSATTHAHLNDARREASGGKVLALGDPDYASRASGAIASVYTRDLRKAPRPGTRSGGSLAPLPATRDEAKAVGDVVLLGKDATEAAFEKALGQETVWRAVHFACHGLVNPHAADLCALALSVDDENDGFLTALELVQMTIPAELAVLSACETGRGQVSTGEGLLGLSRSFIHAGTPRVLCSLWKVDDEATQAFMLKFYELWNPKEGEGIAPAEALRAAKAHVKAQPKWEHPCFWGAWVLWGLPR